MTHAPETGAINRLHFRRRFLVRVSCISGTGFLWYQIPAPIRTLFYPKPESGVHVTEMMTYWSMIIAYVIMCFVVVILLQITNSSFTSLSVTFIFGARNFHSGRIDYGTKNRRRKLAPENRSDLWLDFRSISGTDHMTAMTSVHAKKCCHLVSDTQRLRLCSSLPPPVPDL